MICSESGGWVIQAGKKKKEYQYISLLAHCHHHILGLLCLQDDKWKFAIKPTNTSVYSFWSAHAGTCIFTACTSETCYAYRQHIHFPLSAGLLEKNILVPS